ncbi:MAG: YicC family protein [Clostridia bacterium]|nr:YicC family protein [Deltaproteobacteria bacterium]
MLKSMTGYGVGREEAAFGSVDVEVRSVNARFVKVSVKAPSSLGGREADIEALCAKAVKRGTVNISVNLRSKVARTPMVVNEEVALAYQAVFRRLGLPEQGIPHLPGVMVAEAPEAAGTAEWLVVQKALSQALQGLSTTRSREGQALRAILAGSIGKLSDLCVKVAERVPVVVREHAAKLKDRVNTLLADAETHLDPTTLAREVAVLADRSDVTEELDRLGAHLAHATELFASPDSIGRTLEFLAQEMLREVNTAGSKSADAELARLVIEMKSEVERFKEQVANVE